MGRLPQHSSVLIHTHCPVSVGTGFLKWKEGPLLAKSVQQRNPRTFIQSNALCGSLAQTLTQKGLVMSCQFLTLPGGKDQPNTEMFQWKGIRESMRANFISLLIHSGQSRKTAIAIYWPHYFIHDENSFTNFSGL